jgi:hypothetical protein
MPRIRLARLLSLPVLAAVALTLAGCVPLESPGKTGQIEFVDSSTSDGWKWDHYRNLAYPCSISGYQSFVIGTKVGSSDTATRPLWVRMRGGGVGYFDANGNPQPSAGNKSEESAATSISFVPDRALTGLVRSDPAGFRIVSVSMCNHDIYSGGDQEDPNNPNTTPDGEPRTVNGLFATKAAIAYVKAHYPTSKAVLHGTSAGSAGVYSVAWSMQAEGVPPAGAIADSGSVNRQWEVARAQQNICGDDGRAVGAIAARLHPALTREKNQPDLLIARGDLTVPILHTWSRADPNVCGDTPMTCPLPDGSTTTLGSADCSHELIRRAIAGLGAGSKSRNLRLCVSPAADPGSCATHVVTNKTTPNTDPAEAADYVGTIMDWVHTRLGDP